MRNELKKFRLTKSQSRRVIGGTCKTFEKTYKGDDWWQDNPDSCKEKFEN